MTYSPFSLDRLMTFEKYRRLCQMLLEIPMDQETYTTLKSILFDGGYQGYGFDTGYSNKINPMSEIYRRLGMAYLLLRNKEAFYALADNRISLFHGTNANALPSILKYGINNLKALQKAGIDVTTGEEWSRKYVTSNFTSFTDVIDIAKDYSCINANQKNKKLSFPVVFGITKETAKQAGIKTIPSSVIEVGILGSIPPNSISAIMVPTDKVDLVKKMVDDQIMVLGIDGFNEKFYYIDDMLFEIWEEAFERFRYQVVHNEFPKSSKLTGVNETLLSRMASKVKDKIEKLKELVGVESNEHRNSK